MKSKWLVKKPDSLKALSLTYQIKECTATQLVHCWANKRINTRLLTYCIPVVKILPAPHFLLSSVFVTSALTAKDMILQRRRIYVSTAHREHNLNEKSQRKQNCCSWFMLSTAASPTSCYLQGKPRCVFAYINLSPKSAGGSADW